VKKPEQHKLVAQRLSNGPTLDNGRPTNLCCSGMVGNEISIFVQIKFVVFHIVLYKN